MTAEPQDTSPSPTADVAWNAGELPCGELILELQIRIRELPGGGVIRVRTADAGAPTDLPAWCRLTENQLLHAAHPDYWIRRASPRG